MGEKGGIEAEMSIFCPSNHLMLAETRCPVCGWLRPLPPSAGTMAWGPVNISARLGGPGRSTLFSPAADQGTVVFANDREVVGVCVADGRELWRRGVDEGFVVSGITRGTPGTRSRLLGVLSDRHPLLQVQSSALVQIDPDSGEMTSLWTSGCTDFSLPVSCDGGLIVRTSQSKLVALDTSSELSVRWEVPLETWWAVPPLIDDDLVVITDGQAMQQVGRLCAYRVSDGTPVWNVPLPGGLISHPPVADGRWIIVRGKTLDGRNYLMAFDRNDGQVGWQNSFKALYTRPVASNGVVYFVRRGNADKTAADHYLLSATQIEDGNEIFTIPLEGRRAQWIQLLDEHSLLMACTDGRICCWDLANHALLWELSVGAEDNPPQTVPVQEDGRIVIGTYFGDLSAIQYQAAERTDESGCTPQSRANTLALQGDYGGAGQIYLEEVHEPQKAFVLFERAGNWEQAGKIAFEMGRYEQARTLFEKADNPTLLAMVYETMRDWLNAAEQYLRANNLQKAAVNYEQGGKLREALHLFHQKGDYENYERLRKQVPYDLDDIERLLEQGAREKAARKLLEMGEIRRAIALFEELGLEREELSALEQFNRRSPERWAQERQAKLARQMGDYLLEAETFREMEQISNAAQAYLNAARQAERRYPDQEQKIGDLYLQAKNCFAQEGYIEEAQQCWQNVIHYHHLPWIVLEGRVEKTFRELEFNTITLVLTNFGNGLAKSIVVKPIGGRFEVDSEGTTAIVVALAAQKSQTIPLVIRPLKDQVGENVSFALEWRWYDRDRKEYQDRISILVTVKSKDESHTSNTPVVINAEHFYQGTYISGDQVQSGGQKGDKVEIRRGHGSQISLATGQEKDETTFCPNCDLPITPGAKFCEHCSHPLDAAPASGEAG